MHDGDRVEVEIENIGRLTNTIVEAQAQQKELAI
jgi:2-keto-4-pentenoate hydratase/2-oxohepta-3-ene-1,7-dioic acid hydratase in catechol pathway